MCIKYVYYRCNNVIIPYIFDVRFIQGNADGSINGLSDDKVLVELDIAMPRPRYQEWLNS